MNLHCNRARSFRASLLRGRCLTLVLGAALGLVSGTTPTQSHAAIYKCVNVTGGTTYSGSPCADDESTKRISKTASALPAMDCTVAQKFAADTTRRMMAGESSGELFASYGGTSATTPFVLGLVSYVYSFEGHQSISEARLTSLSTERCESGSFGPVGRRCDAFPGEFIERQGGCNVARNEVGQKGTFDGPTPVAPAVEGGSSFMATGTGYALPALGEANASTASNAVTVDRRADCQQRLQRTIDQTAKQMREPQGASSQDRLSKRHRQLRSQLSRC